MERHRYSPTTDELYQLITQKKATYYTPFFKKYHEADIAEQLAKLPLSDQYQFFLNVTPELGVDVLEEMNLTQQIDFIGTLKTTLAAKYIEEMEPDDAADLIEELQDTDQSKADDIINALPKAEAKDLQELLTYKDDSAGSIMTSQYVSIPENLTVNDALQDIRAQNPPDSEISFYIFITDKDHYLLGVTTLRNLLMTKENQSVRSIRNDYAIKAHVDDDQENIALLFQKYDVVALPVVDNDNRLMGLITVDDVVDIVIEEATEDIYKLSGTSEIDEEKLINGPIIYAVFSRVPWLGLTVLGGIFASILITQFSVRFHNALFPLALSLSFVPMLMGLAGNVGNQSATIVVRGIATGHLKSDQTIRYILRELFIGTVIGLVTGGLIFILTTYIFRIQTLLVTIVSVSVILNIVAATVLGVCLPIGFRKLKIDPAIASAPFISTILDIIGQAIYFFLTLSVIAGLAPL